MQLLVTRGIPHGSPGGVVLKLILAQCDEDCDRGLYGGQWAHMTWGTNSMGAKAQKTFRR